MTKIECDCPSCGYVFEVDKEEIAEKGKETCPNCDFEHCVPEELKRDPFEIWQGKGYY